MQTFSCATTKPFLNSKLIEIMALQEKISLDKSFRKFNKQFKKTLKSCEERNAILEKIFPPTDGLSGSGKVEL